LNDAPNPHISQPEQEADSVSRHVARHSNVEAVVAQRLLDIGMSSYDPSKMKV